MTKKETRKNEQERTKKKMNDKERMRNTPIKRMNEKG